MESTFQKTAAIVLGLGALATVTALGLLYYGFRDFSMAKWSHPGVTLMLIGSLVWCWSVFSSDGHIQRHATFRILCSDHDCRCGIIFWCRLKDIQRSLFLH